jgi:hypothetical protein
MKVRSTIRKQMRALRAGCPMAGRRNGPKFRCGRCGALYTAVHQCRLWAWNPWRANDGG